MNLKSKLLNKSAIAKRLQMNVQTFHDKLTGRGSAKPFTADELKQIEKLILKDLKIFPADDPQ